MLVRWRNNWNYPGISDMFDDFFNNDVAHFAGQNRPVSMPAVNVRELQDRFEIDVAAPGLRKEDFRVSVDHNVLTIAAEQETRIGYDPNTTTQTAGPADQNQPGNQPAADSLSGQNQPQGQAAAQSQPAIQSKAGTQAEKYTRREFSYTSFQRSFALPESASPEKIAATYKDGILCVTVPKRDQTQARLSRQIDIS